MSFKFIITNILLLLSLVIFILQCTINQKYNSSLLYTPQVKEPFINNKWEQPCHIQEYPKDTNPSLVRWKFLVSPQRNTKNPYKRKRESQKHLTQCINYFLMKNFFESNPLIILKPSFKPIQKQIFLLLQQIKTHKIEFDSLQNIEALIYIRAPQVRNLLKENVLLDQ